MNPPPSDGAAVEEDQKRPPAHIDERSLAAILDNVDAAIYVADMRTHELLYLNAYGRARFGDFEGRHCWEVLQKGQSGPCEFCTNDRLLNEDGTPAGVYVWGFQNTANGRWYQCRDQAIRWGDGRMVRLEIATDITDRKRMELQLEAANARAETLAYTDELTGLPNRRAFFERGARMFERNRRRNRSTAVMIFDIDYFKRINDTFGHPGGDEALRAIARSVRPVLREGDMFARLGGEEFAILLAVDHEEQAMAAAERVRAAVAGIELRYGNRLLRCTASFGVAFCPRGGKDLETMLQEADHALFVAKRSGRDRVVFAG